MTPRKAPATRQRGSQGMCFSWLSSTGTSQSAPPTYGRRVGPLKTPDLRNAKRLVMYPSCDVFFLLPFGISTPSLLPRLLSLPPMSFATLHLPPPREASRLSPCNPLAKAAFKVVADGGANRVHDELPGAFSDQPAQVVRNRCSSCLLLSRHSQR